MLVSKTSCLLSLSRLLRTLFVCTKNYFGFFDLWPFSSSPWAFLGSTHRQHHGAKRLTNRLRVILRPAVTSSPGTSGNSVTTGRISTIKTDLDGSCRLPWRNAISVTISFNSFGIERYTLENGLDFVIVNPRWKIGNKRNTTLLLILVFKCWK